MAAPLGIEAAAVSVARGKTVPGATFRAGTGRRHCACLHDARLRSPPASPRPNQRRTKRSRARSDHLCANRYLNSSRQFVSKVATEEADSAPMNLSGPSAGKADVNEGEPENTR